MPKKNGGSKPPRPPYIEGRSKFDRRFPSLNSCRKELLSPQYGYSAERFNQWLSEDPPRILPSGTEGGVWSAINPYAQHLAKKTVLMTEDGLEAWVRIAAERVERGFHFPMYVFVAGSDGPRQGST